MGVTGNSSTEYRYFGILLQSCAQKLWTSIYICKSSSEKISGTVLIWTRCIYSVTVTIYLGKCISSWIGGFSPSDPDSIARSCVTMTTSVLFNGVLHYIFVAILSTLVVCICNFRVELNLLLNLSVLINQTGLRGHLGPSLRTTSTLDVPTTSTTSKGQCG